MISKNVSILNYWNSPLFFQMQININEPLALRGSLKSLAAHVQPFRAQLCFIRVFKHEETDERGRVLLLYSSV